MKNSALLTTSALAFMATFLAVGTFASAAHADTPVSCAVVEIEATTSDAPSIGAELRPLEKKLKKPPFSSWNTFKQLGSHAVTLETMKSSTLTLTHGKAQLLLREVTTRGQKKTRISLGIAVDDAEGKRVLDSKVAVDAGDYLVVGRSLKGNRGHLLAMNCKP